MGIYLPNWLTIGSAVFAQRISAPNTQIATAQLRSAARRIYEQDRPE